MYRLHHGLHLIMYRLQHGLQLIMRV